MRLLLAVILGLASGGWAAADVRQVLYGNSLCGTEQSLTDCSGNGRTLISGTSAITITATNHCEGGFAFTGFNPTVVLRVPAPSSWANDVSLTVQLYLYVTATPAVTYQIFNYSNSVLSQNSGFSMRADRGIDFTTYNTLTKSAASVIPLNTCVYLAGHWGADGNKFFVTVNPTSTNISNVPLLSNSTIGAYVVNDNAMQFGRYSLAGGLDCGTCTIDSMRVSTGDIPVLPTTDMHAPSTGTRSMNLGNGMTMDFCCGGR